MAEKEYQRLTRARPRSGFGIALVARSSLWLGKDHLLCVDSNGYAETYKRFYFRDIQAFLLYRTERWKMRGLLFGVLAVLLTLFAILARENVGLYILGGLAAIFYLGLILEVTAGPTCVCHVQTAVQTEQLPSLNRIRQTRRVMQHLRPLIAAAQGQIAPEEIPARVQEWRGASQTPAPTALIATVEAGEDPNLPPRIVS